MVSSEILAISAIFISGIYIGIKVKSALIGIREYFEKRKI